MCATPPTVAVCDDEVMVSFDVVLLFTSIPTDIAAVEACTSALESNRALPDLRQALLPSMALLWVSVTAANLTIEWLEHLLLSVQDQEFLRYVDDCFCVIQLWLHSLRT